MTARTARTGRLGGLLRPLLPSAADYRGLGRTWRVDLLSGLTVGIVALPLALAFGISSGAGAEAGLITAIVAGVVAAVFGGSNVQVSGPTGAMVVVLAPIVASHGPGAVVTVSLIAGVMIIIAGVLRLGRVVELIPWPVIEGFTLGIAIIIFLQQVPSAVSSAGHDSNAVIAAVQAISAIRWPEAAWPLGAIAVVVAIMIIAPKLHPRVPGSIIAIIVVTGAAVLLDVPLPRIGELPAGLPAPALPPLDPGIVISLLGPAAAVAGLAAIESLLSARVASAMADTGPIDPDRELVGQGLASLAAGLFGGMPATGAIARTAVNVRSGARTRVASTTHALVLLLIVLVGAAAVSRIPVAALAGVLMVTATRMISLATVRLVLRASRSAALTFLITAVITVAFDLIIAVVIGLAVATFFALRTLARSSGVHREPIPDHPRAGDEEIALFRIDGALFFGAAQRLVDRVLTVDGVTVVVLRLSQLHLLDVTGARILVDLVHTLERRGITVLIKGIRREHLRVLTRVGVIDSLRHENHLFDDLVPAIAHARDHVRRARLSSPS